MFLCAGTIQSCSSSVGCMACSSGRCTHQKMVGADSLRILAPSPRPLVAFDCGSQSTSSVFTSAAAKDEARLMAVVVLPTPPFWLATAMTRPI